MVRISADEVSVVARGFCRRDLERQASRECERVLGVHDTWRFTSREIVPCMVSPGGRVRLYEGRFVARRA
jgi:hypothetical protein